MAEKIAVSCKKLAEDLTVEGGLKFTARGEPLREVCQAAQGLAVRLAPSRAYSGLPQYRGELAHPPMIVATGRDQASHDGAGVSGGGALQSLKFQQTGAVAVGEFDAGRDPSGDAVELSGVQGRLE